jgi:hypothetical protein
MSSAVRIARSREEFPEPRDGGETKVELVDVVLREIGDAHVAIQPNHAVDWLQFTEKHFHQGRLGWGAHTTI